MIDRVAPALKVENLVVEYRVAGEQRTVLRNISFEIARGECFGLVGESGCGKSTAAYSVLRYLPRNGSITEGCIDISGQDLLSLDEGELREMRRKSVSMVYQDPSRALNPTVRIGRQVQEVFELAGVPRKDWPRRVAEILSKVRIADPLHVMERYPHQLSGGMQQRVAIAMALASEPTLLILDEPTTGLDATVEADVLDLISLLRREFSTAILFISHNLGVIAKMCDRVGVLYAGQLVEEGRADALFREPKHPYTAGLLRCLPQVNRSKSVAPLASIPGFLPQLGVKSTGCVFAPRCALSDERCKSVEPELSDLNGRLTKCHYPERIANPPDQVAGVAAQAINASTQRPILQIQQLSKSYSSGSGKFRALSEVNLELRAGETLGLVGESGSGKTTLARSILGVVEPDAESIIRVDGEVVAPALAGRTKSQIKSVQLIFQNPDSALNRSHSVRRMIGRTITKLVGLRGAARNRRVQEMTASVQLADHYLNVKPRQLSGGLKQRVAIARAFAGDPRIVVCDEPTSALDVSVQAAILNLLTDLQRDKKVSYIFVSHDLGVVRYLSDRIAVLYLGRVMEVGPAEEVFAGPHHPYTEALLSSVPQIGNKNASRVKLNGEIPSAVKPPSGCVFHTRCQCKLGKICEDQVPQLSKLNSEHVVACHIPAEQLPQATAYTLKASSN